jgi:hypothetical protein
MDDLIEVETSDPEFLKGLRIPDPDREQGGHKKKPEASPRAESPRQSQQYALHCERPETRNSRISAANPTANFFIPVAS